MFRSGDHDAAVEYDVEETYIFPKCSLRRRNAVRTLKYVCHVVPSGFCRHRVFTNCNTNYFTSCGAGAPVVDLPSTDYHEWSISVENVQFYGNNET